jgi:hypothetical protein
MSGVATRLGGECINRDVGIPHSSHVMDPTRKTVKRPRDPPHSSSMLRAGTGHRWHTARRCACTHIPPHPGRLRRLNDLPALVSALRTHSHELASGSSALATTASLLRRSNRCLDQLQSAKTLKREARAGAAAQDLRSALVGLLERLDSVGISLHHRSGGDDDDEEELVALCHTLGWAGRAARVHAVPMPASLQVQLVQRISAGEDTMSSRVIAEAAEAAAAAFAGPPSSVSAAGRDQASSLMATVARRAEILVLDGQMLQSSANISSPGRPGEAAAAAAAAAEGSRWLDELATVMWCCGQLQIFNLRLLDDVLTPSLHAVSITRAYKGGNARGVMPKAAAVGKICWAVGRLAPPLPALVRWITAIVQCWACICRATVTRTS